MPKNHVVGINPQSTKLNKKKILLFKKKRSKSNNEELDTYKEKERSKELQKFNPALQGLHKLKHKEVSKFYINVHNVSPQSGVLLCIHFEEETKLDAFSLENIAYKMGNVSKDLTQEEHIAKFLESLPLSKKNFEILEIKTRGQSENYLWSALR